MVGGDVFGEVVDIVYVGVTGLILSRLLRYASHCDDDDGRFVVMSPREVRQRRLQLLKSGISGARTDVTAHLLRWRLAL